jgi:hypothetical protein
VKLANLLTMEMPQFGETSDVDEENKRNIVRYLVKNPLDYGFWKGQCSKIVHALFNFSVKKRQVLKNPKFWMNTSGYSQNNEITTDIHFTSHVFKSYLRTMRQTEFSESPTCI